MTDTELETLRVARPTAGTAVVTLNRPDRLNAMTERMFADLAALPPRLEQDDDLRAVIVTGAGRGFCAGYDLDHFAETVGRGARELLKFQELATGALAAIRGLRVPVIAAIHGAAVGGGLSLALAADIRLAAPDARFSAGFVKVGLSCGELGTSWQLTRLIGPGRAAELAYTARTVDAEEAARIGLVNRVVGDDALLDEALAMAQHIAANSAAGVQLSKRALQANMEIASYAAALELENRGQTLLAGSADVAEGASAIKERREPRFTGW